MTKPIKFRAHRGSLKDSMSTIYEIKSKEEFLDSVKKEARRIGLPPLEPDEISIERYGYDQRINWDTHIVLARNKITLGRAVIGFTDGDIDSLE